MAKQHQLPSDETLHGGERGSALRKLLWTGAAVGAAAAVNALIFYRTPPLTSPLEGGEIRYFPTPDGDVFYKKAGESARSHCGRCACARFSIVRQSFTVRQIGFSLLLDKRHKKKRVLEIALV